MESSQAHRLQARSLCLCSTSLGLLLLECFLQRVLGSCSMLTRSCCCQAVLVQLLLQAMSLIPANNRSNMLPALCGATGTGNPNPVQALCRSPGD